MSELLPANNEGRDPILLEIAWEVVNQVGGIYTVLRSKAPAMTSEWGDHYALVGPYRPETANVEFEESADDGPIGEAVALMKSWGFEVKYGYWLVTGRPRVILLDPNQAMDKVEELKGKFWEDHKINGLDEHLVVEVIAFGYLVETLCHALAQAKSEDHSLIAHFHEWMGGSALPRLKHAGLPIATIFTTHATMLGRYLAMNDPWFYDHLPFVDWAADADRFNIRGKVMLERAAAHGAHVFTTVSDVTAWECEHLIGRKVDMVTPNGLNIQRFTAMHEFQNLHLEFKRKIHQFTMSHFFHSYSFDLDNTLYFFTSGRYEYRNKGFDITSEALARLNWRMREANHPITVVMFYITKSPFKSINPQVLNSRGMLTELRQCCQAIQEQVGDRLFEHSASTQEHTFPDVTGMVDDYWRLRLRRTMQSWKSNQLPLIVTHDLHDDQNDQLLNTLRSMNLVNDPYDRVKVVYHPDFVKSTSPLWGIDYDDFVRGCHLGIFPSYYEPWGYTPLECMARGVPALTSDLSGFGGYVLDKLPEHENTGLKVLRRRHESYEDAAQEMADYLWDFVNRSRRDRISERNRTEAASGHFDWHNLVRYYNDAHAEAIRRLS